MEDGRGLINGGEELGKKPSRMLPMEDILLYTQEGVFFLKTLLFNRIFSHIPRSTPVLKFLHLLTLQ